MDAGRFRLFPLCLLALFAAPSGPSLRAEDASRSRPQVDLGASLREGPAIEGRHLIGRSAAVLSAAQGKAFVLETEEGRPTAKAVSTSRPVYKAFGLDAAGQRLLYRPLEAGAPSGELLVEDLATGQARRVGTDHVIEAAWSPRDRNLLAYTFSSEGGFGLAVANLRTGRTTPVWREEVLADHLAFERDGSGVYYYRAVERDRVGVDDSGLTVADHSFTVLTPSFHPLRARSVAASRAAEEVTLAALPAGFPVLETLGSPEEPVDVIPEEAGAETPPRRRVLKSVELPARAHAFRAVSPTGTHEVRGDDLLADGPLFVRELPSGALRRLGEGRIVQVLQDGVLVRRAQADGATLEFLGYDGQRAAVAAAAPAAYGVPFSTAYVSQGGQGFPSPGCSTYYTHKVGSSMAFANDFVNTAGHVLASAAGTVAYLRNDVTCNGCAGASCSDYRSSCTGAVANSGWGNVVILEHADGTWTKYTHLRPGSVRVARGQAVCAGLFLANQGHTGCTAGGTCGDHLHFQRQSSSALSGPSVRVSFFDTPTNPIACYRTYTSGLTEAAACGPTFINNSVPATSWKGEYFLGLTPTGSAKMIRDEGAQALAFDWGVTSPGCALPADGFSARFTRTATFAAGTYRFSVKADDGVRVWIDGVLLLDKWLDQTATFTFDKALSAGAHALKVEYFENTGSAALALSFEAVQGVAQFVCDDGDACLTLTSAYWHPATSCGGAALGYGGDMAWTTVNGSVVSSTARFTPILGGPGRYAVSVFIPRCNGTSVQAKYQIVHGGVTEPRTVNQNAASDVWVGLGTFAFTGLAGEYVELTDATGEAPSSGRKLAVDAVRFVRQ